MWRHKGIKIDLTGEGQFSATVDDVTVFKCSLSDAREAIDKLVAAGSKRKLNLKVIGFLKKQIQSWQQSQEEGVIAGAILTGINRTSRALQFEGIPKGYELTDVIADTPENRSHLERLAEFTRYSAVIKAAQAEKDLRASGYGRIEAGNYDEVLDELEKRYSKSSGEGSAAVGE